MGCKASHLALRNTDKKLSNRTSLAALWSYPTIRREGSRIQIPILHSISKSGVWWSYRVPGRGCKECRRVELPAHRDCHDKAPQKGGSAGATFQAPTEGAPGGSRCE